MKNTVLSASIAIGIAILSTSCNGDEPKAQEQSTRKVKSIEEVMNTGNNRQDIARYELQYDNGKLSKYTFYDDSQKEYIVNQIVKYNGNQVEISGISYDYNFRQLYTLNPNTGYATTVNCEDITGQFTTMNAVFKYENEYLSELDITASKSDGETENAKFKIYYEEGNITKIDLIDNTTQSTRTITKVSYSQGATKTFHRLDAFTMAPIFDEYFTCAYYAGILGKPQSGLIKNINNGNFWTFDYQLDNDGYIQEEHLRSIISGKDALRTYEYTD